MGGPRGRGREGGTRGGGKGGREMGRREGREGGRETGKREGREGGNFVIVGNSFPVMPAHFLSRDGLARKCK